MRKLVTTFLLLFALVFSIEARAQITPGEQQNIINLQDQIIQRQEQIESDKVKQRELKQVAKEKQEIIKEEAQEELDEFIAEDGKIIQDYRRIQCFRVQEITFLENRLIPKNLESDLTKDYVGKCLNVEQITQLNEEITNYIVAEGYITSRAEIPQQSLYRGALSIQVIESYLEDIIFNENDFFDKAQRFSAFGLFEKGGILNIKPIERALDQVNRLQSSNATIKILPGTKKDHSIVLVETRSEKPAHFNVSYDNNGNERTGSRRETVGFSYDNLLQLNDVVSFQRTANDFDEKRKKNGGINSFNGNISVPIVSYTFNLSYSNSDYFFHSGDISRFKSSGETSTTAMALDRVFTKTKTTKIASGLSLTKRYNRNFIEDVRIEASSRKATFLTANYSQTFFLKNATFFIKPTYSKAVDMFDSKQDASNAASFSPHAEFDIFRFYSNYTRDLEYFSKKFSYNLVIDAQASAKRLYGIDQFSVGGIYSVRGFKNGSISGDSGYNLRNEISIGLGQIFNSEKWNLQRFSITPFYDYGYVRSKDGIFSGRLSGAGAKISFYHPNINASLTFSHSLSRSHLLQEKDYKDDKAIFFNIYSGFSL
jgi:hemolysin activation/secretion protein